MTTKNIIESKEIVNVDFSKEAQIAISREMDDFSTLSVQDVKNIFDFIFNAYYLLVDVLKDGKVSLTELFLISELIGRNIATITANAIGALSTFMSLTKEDKKEILTFFEEKFSLKNKLTENIIERVFEIVLTVLQIISSRTIFKIFSRIFK